jgi:ribosome-binding factor A
MMTRSNRVRDLLANVRAEADADDGADPREFFKKEGSSNTKSGRKAQQLCAQVAETLQQLLGGGCGDEILQALCLIEVSPAPDASQMLVVVGPALGAAPRREEDVQTALERASGWLRSEIAAAITRKRAPRLVFRYLPGNMSGEVRT